MWLGPLPGPALGWPASASRLGHAGLQFFGASALAAHRPGGLFPPQASAPRSRRSIATCCCGFSKTSCSGSSRPTKLPTFVPGGSNEVVLEVSTPRLLPQDHTTAYAASSLHGLLLSVHRSPTVGTPLESSCRIWASASSLL